MKQLIKFCVILALFASCSVVKYVPVETIREVHVKDSVYLRDTLIKHQIEREYVRDWTGLLDTLKMDTQYSEFKAYADTTKGILAGEAKNKDKVLDIPAQMKEKIVYRDSIITKEVPVPVEVTKEVVKIPWLYRLFAGIGIIALGLLFGWGLGKYLHRW